MPDHRAELKAQTILGWQLSSTRILNQPDPAHRMQIGWPPKLIPVLLRLL